MRLGGKASVCVLGENGPGPRTRSLVAAVLAGAAGIATGHGFAPTDQVPLLLTGLTVLVLLLHRADARGGAVLGFAFGLGFMATLTYWITVYGSLAWVALTLTQALFLALFGAAGSRIVRLPACELWLAATWVAVELARSSLPLGGFAWGRLAYALVDVPAVGWVRWIGVPATSGLVLLCAALLARAVFSIHQRRPVATGAAVIGAVALGGVGSILPVGVAGPSGIITVAAVQGDVPGTGADGLGEQREVLSNHVDLTQRLAEAVAAGTASQPDVVFWPENASDVDPLTDDAARRTVSEAVDRIGVPVLVGAIVDGPTPDTARNVGIVWSPQTGPGAVYVKRHLVPFGEYVPFRDLSTRLVPRLGEEIPRDLLPGNEPGVLRLGPVVIGDLICFDIAFDNQVRDVVASGAQLLVVQTNNAGYVDTVQPEQQWALSRVAAVAAGRDLVVAATTGISGVAQADGSVTQQTRQGTPVTVVAAVMLGSKPTWGVRVGRFLEYALSALAVAGFLTALVRSRSTVTGSGIAKPPQDVG